MRGYSEMIVSDRDHKKEDDKNQDHKIHRPTNIAGKMGSGSLLKKFHRMYFVMAFLFE
jgi:hypothetical protein